MTDSATQVAGHQDGNTAKVLIVDDDPALLRMLRLWLTGAGMDVTTANDGIEALDQVEATDHFDVIVLDLQMPRLDGRGFCKEMARRGHPGQIVILSAYGADAAGRELDAAAAISKPFDPEVLVETVLSLA